MYREILNGYLSSVKPDDRDSTHGEGRLLTRKRLIGRGGFKGGGR